MRVGEVMSRSVEWIGPDATLQEAAEMMKSLDVGPLPVCENDRLVGIITDRDITVRATAEGKAPADTSIRDVMTPGIHYCFEDSTVGDAARLMEEWKVRRLVVIDSTRQMVGIVSLGDLAVEPDGRDWNGATSEDLSQLVPPAV